MYCMSHIAQIFWGWSPFWPHQVGAYVCWSLSPGSSASVESVMRGQLTPNLQLLLFCHAQNITFIDQDQIIETSVNELRRFVV